MNLRPPLRRWWRHTAVAVLVLAALVLVRYWLYLQHLRAPLNLPAPYVLTIGSGSNFTRVLRQLRQDAVIDNNDLSYYVRLHDLASRIRAGEYELVAGMTQLGFLQMLLEGRVIEYQARIGEGWTLRDAIKALQAHQAIKATLDAENPPMLQAAFGAERYPEGLVLPETFNFVRGTTDLDLLLRGKALMDKLLATVWQERDAGLPYQSPYEALVMASIIEKESGQVAEQAQISGVFVRRLQQHMKLQTDPSVIYGIGPAFDGNLTRKQLETDTPYNSYIRDGLPPTPIALPSRNALLASVHPAEGNALYFVAKGDGTHYFSATLAEHNAAVKQYQLGRKP